MSNKTKGDIINRLIIFCIESDKFFFFTLLFKCDSIYNTLLIQFTYYYNKEKKNKFIIVRYNNAIKFELN